MFAAGCVATSPLRSAGFTETLTASVNLPAAPRGTLLIVGGGSQHNQLVQQFVDLAGGRGKARIAILPMATSAAAEAGAEKEAINHCSLVQVVDRRYCARFMNATTPGPSSVAHRQVRR